MPPAPASSQVTARPAMLMGMARRAAAGAARLRPAAVAAADDAAARTAVARPRRAAAAAERAPHAVPSLPGPRAHRSSRRGFATAAGSGALGPAATEPATEPESGPTPGADAVSDAGVDGARPRVVGGGGRSVGRVETGGAAGAELIDLNPPKGTRDFPPEDMRLRTWLFGHWRAVAALFGFEEVDAPVLESEALFIRKAGEEISSQLYCFEDKGGRRVALRPELTPSLARMVLAKGKALPLPAKWYAIGQCWRYERMSRGRRREHYQWNMDVVGCVGLEAEAELLAAIVTFFRRVGLTPADIGLRVSSRKVLAAAAAAHGVPSSAFGAVCVAVDKMAKVPRTQLESELAAAGLSPEACDGVIASLGHTDISALAATLGPAGDEAAGDLRRLFALAADHGISEWLTFDASVVRGLAYYTGVVFEGFDRRGELRAVCGGGRYDSLLAALGGAPCPAVGFGFGDAVIVELLRDLGRLPVLHRSVDDLVMPLDEAQRPAATALAARLRGAGRAVDLVLEPKKLKWAFKHAEAAGAARLIMLGGDEAARGAARVKVLATREEAEVPLADV